MSASDSKASKKVTKEVQQAPEESAKKTGVSTAAPSSRPHRAATTSQQLQRPTPDATTTTDMTHRTRPQR